ncbi:MAG: penicillin-binding protein [Bacteroidales bacterium]|jgi:cell division protein FtsI (penicillin-binding protein 3)|nr:penicillin-binding protein [Bacteroidales bacterium]
MAASNNTGVVIRFAIVYFIVVFGFALVVRKIVHIQYSEKDRWIALSDSLRKVNKQFDVEPNRGNIYSCNGELMASTVPSYYLYMDFMTPTLQSNEGKVFYKNLDSLSYYLSRKLGDKSEDAYRRHLLKGYHQKKRHYRISRVKVSHVAYKKIKQFPLFRMGFRSGLITEKRIKRIKPYGSLASITIGSLYGMKAKGARNGLEAAYDSILSGKSCKAHLERKAGVNIQIADEEPQNGADLTSTINMNMQDIAEKALRDKLIELDAELGCVALMEVKTGQIKACVNLTKVGDSTYYEVVNFMLRSELEPGSTQKIPSLMVALEDGVVKPNSIVDCGDGTWKFSDEIEISDHNTGDKANGKIDMTQVIVRSSNVGMAKMIDNAYKDNPQEFVNALREMGVGMPMDIGFSGTAEAEIKGPDENPLWGPSDLASMSFGYSVNMPLLYTLTFYNAIANNGQMLQPSFVNKITRNGELLQENAPVVLKKSVCSQKTLDIIKKMMLQVVEDSLYATGKPVRSKYVRIAGKTSTVRYNYKVKWRRKLQVSFCGFYPYDNPEYSCIVYIRNPKRGVPSGGSMAGPVFKDIAERVMASHSLIPIKKYPVDSTNIVQPIIKRGLFEASNRVLLDLKLINKSTDDLASNTQEKKEEENETSLPNVKGMGAKDAIFLLEKKGLKVLIEGRGSVVHQSILPGTKAIKGSHIKLRLR